MAKLITAISPFQGHVGPLLTVTDNLVRAGHEVLVTTGAAFADQVRASGARFAPLPAEVDFDGRNMARHFPEFSSLPPGPAMHRFFWNRVFLDAVPAQSRDLERLLDEFDADVLIHDQVYLGAFPLVLRRDAVRRPLTLSLGVLPPTLLSKDAVPFALGLTARDAEGAGARIRELNELAQRTYADVQAHAATVFAALGVHSSEFIFTSMVTVPDHYLQLSVPGFEYPRSDLPASFQFVGGLPLRPLPSYREPAWWPELASGGRPVVVVTQGTLANEDLTALLVPTLRALADRDALVVAATARPDGPDDVRRVMGDIPDNVRLEGFVPFDRLLPFADVLITNGGYGGVHTALQHGLPLIVAGDTEDKLDVSARVQWSGVGLDLRTGHPTEAALRSAVDQVLSDATYRENAGRLRAELSRYRPLEAIAALVEELTAEGCGGRNARLPCLG